MDSVRRVGFVGQGQMGVGLADRLEEAGYELVRVDPVAAAADVPSLAEAGSLDAVCVSVPGPAELHAVIAQLCTGSAAHPRYLFNFTTVGPTHSVQVDARLRRQAPAIRFAECPVSGGVVAARRGECAILFGSRSGPPSRAQRRLLGALSRRTFVLGGVAAASTAKLVNNVVAVSTGLATLEALEVGLAAGLSRECLFEVLAAGTADSYILHNSLRRALLEGDLRTGFQACLAHKDMALAAELAEGQGLSRRYIDLAAEALGDGIERSHPELTFVAAAAPPSLVPAERQAEAMAAEIA